MVSLKYNGLHSKYQKLTNEYWAIQNKFDLMRVETQCDICPIGVEDKKKNIKDKCLNCKKDKACIKVIDFHKKMMNLKNKLNQLRDEYAEKIHIDLIKNNTQLFNLRTKETHKWSDVFDEDFSKITSEKRDLLVSLIEEDGGYYRIM